MFQAHTSTTVTYHCTKMFSRRVILLLSVASILNVCELSLSDHGTYCVGDSQQSNCSPDCVNFQNIADILQSNTVVQFCSGIVEINAPIFLENRSNITSLGHSSMRTTLSCMLEGAGLTLVNLNDSMIKDIKIENCSSKYNVTTQFGVTGATERGLLSSAVHVINCNNFKLDNVQIHSSHGLGLVLYDTGGNVEVLHSVFLNNSNSDTFVGGGVLLAFTNSAPAPNCSDYCDNSKDNFNLTETKNVYVFKNCTFHKNKAYFHGPKYLRYSKQRDRQGTGRGGGLFLNLNGKSEYNIFTIENCTFSENEANWGGGLYIVIQDSSRHNIIQLNKIIVIKNKAKKNFGGGGVNLGFNSTATMNNSVRFERSTFKSNSATFGGGISIYSSYRNESELPNTIEFRSCQWINNTARFGSAIDIAPHVWEFLSSGFLPVPIFHSCEFRSNNGDTVPNLANTTGYMQYKTGKGALMLTKFEVIFSGIVSFIDNSGSALFLSSSIIKISQLTTCNFEGNRGFEGGAIAFIGYSALIVNDNTSFYFSNNTATRRGGAIFAYAVDEYYFISSRSCFLQYHGSLNLVERNVTFEFVNNSAGYKCENQRDCYASGHSIFSPSLLTCIHACESASQNNYSESVRYNRNDTFKCVGMFQFSGSDIKCQVSTAGGSFDVHQLDFQNKQFLEMYPGRDIEFDVSVYNDFKDPINAVYYAALESQNNSNINIQESYSYISNRKMRLHGSPGSKGVLKLRALTYRETMLEVHVALTDCPPGYVLGKTSDRVIDGRVYEKCVCSTAHSSTALRPIQECNDKSLQSNLKRGYWLGYHNNRFEYSYCPSGYCVNLYNKTSILPKHVNLLDDSVCGKYRTGRLCGQCKSDYSVHYHSSSYLCGNNDTCSYGWLLYIISELLPLTILFLIATVLNISFTSGAVNGFIWFAQVVHSIPVTGKSFIIFPESVNHIYTVTSVIYNFFNFDFFSHNRLSFCLWKGATTMDMLVFKFITVVYAVLLVITTVALVKYCGISFFHKCKCFRISTVKTSIIHGLSSVLVIVFTQCFEVCCQVLEIGYVYGEGNTFYTTAVFLEGHFTPFSGEHIKYAILAVFCMLIMIIPMFLLLIYHPITFNALKLVRCSDTNPVARKICHLPYSKLKPFLDSFQGCFKDNYRIFAGLYFVYRILIIFTILVPSLTDTYVTLESFLVIFLLVHAIAQPYQQRSHNIIDGLLFINLIAINKIAFYNYRYSKSPENFNPLPFTSTITVILLNTPLICMLVYIASKLACKIKILIWKNSTSNDSSEDFELPDRDSESDSEGSVDYQRF